MKSAPKLIRQFIGILLLSFLFILILNFTIIIIIATKPAPNSSPWTTAKEVGLALQKSDSQYILPKDISAKLKKLNIWAIFIDNATHKVVWHTDNLPNNIPKKYSISDIAQLTRGYINSYPTFTGESDNGLIVLGYPKTSYWKHMWPSWDYNLIAHFPQIVFFIFICNIFLIFLIFITVNIKFLKTVNPIIEGIQNLPTKQPVYIKEKGVLSELAANINRTSEVLQFQNRQLKKKEIARVNWISGVSHDIRTPLSMVMGYAGQLEESSHLTEEEHKKITIILKQSKKIKNLINNLNLASKLEYNTQPINLKQENVITIVRQVVVDFINMDIDLKYPIEWKTDEKLSSCIMNIDKDLLKRAVNNLIQNCINHNPNGCTIYVSIEIKQEKCIILVEDNGVGAADEQIKKLNNMPHYMISDNNTLEQRHGLGLLIVKQIIASHNGETIINHSVYKGFAVKMILPI